MQDKMSLEDLARPKMYTVFGQLPDRDPYEEKTWGVGRVNDVVRICHVVAVDVKHAIAKFEEKYPEHVITSVHMEHGAWEVL